MGKSTIAGKKAINKNGTIKYIDLEQLDDYLQDGWVIGKGKPSWNAGVKGKQIAWNKGLATPTETKIKISNKLTGRKLSAQHVKNRTAAQTGLKRTEEFKEHQRLAAIGHVVSKETRQKISIKNKGKSHPCSEEAKHKISLHHSSKAFQEYQRNKKIKNGTINTSKPETDCFNKLVNKYGKDAVIRWYSEVRYPFECDCYIKQLDLFIEFNFHWTHGPHKYTASSLDIALLNKWKQKQSFYINSKGKKVKNLYCIAEEVWTKRDIMKYAIAEQNNLNYLTFYTINAFEDWFNTEE